MPNSGRILIVVDEPQWRSDISSLLTGAGYLVTEASTGQECLRLVKENKPDLILLGVVLPDVDGIEVCRRVKSDPQLADTYVVLLLAPNTTLDGRAEDPELKGDGYILWPISNQELLARIELTMRLKRAEEALREQAHSLGQRLRELNCLYSISRLVDEPGITFDELLQSTVDLLPPVWQYPEIACARIRFGDQEFGSKRCQETIWKQASDILVNDEQVGMVEVFYLEERPEHDEGPFQKEERHLIDAIAERLGSIAERMQAQDRVHFQAQLLDSVRESVVATDLEGHVAYWGKGAEALYGYRADEVMGRLITFIVKPREQEQEIERMRQVQENGSWKGQYVQQRRDGTSFWADTAISLVTDQKGQPCGMIGIDRDITDRVQADKALHDALETAQQHQREVSSLVAASRAVLERREFADTARSVFDSCRDLLGATGGYVALLTRDGTENEVLFLESGGLPCTVNPSLPMPIRGLRAEAYRTGKTVYHNAFAQSEWTRYLPAGHVAMDNVLFAPLVIEGNPVGLLGLANKPGGFTEDDARIALAFGELVAIALRNGRALEALARSEERFRAVAETAHDAIISADSSGRLTFWNPAAEALFGYSADEAVGKPATMLVPERFRRNHQQAMQQAFSTGRLAIAGRTMEMVGLRKDGSVFPLELSLAMWQAREESFLTAIMQDITERKQVEEALRHYSDDLEMQVAERTAELRASEAQFRALFEQAVLGIAIGDTEGRILESNRALQEALGFSAEEIRGKTLAEFSHPEDASAVMTFHRGISERDTRDFRTEMRYIRKDGQVRWANVTASLIQAENHPRYTLGILEDVTRQRQTQAALIESEKLAMVGQLATSVAHEVNNPLQSVFGLLCLAQEVLEGGGDISQYVDIAIDELDRTVRVMGQVRDLGRPSQSRERQPTDVNLLVDKALLLNQKRCQDAGVQVEWEARHDLPTPLVRSDHIEQVFLNLMLNALDAMPDGGRLQVSVKATEQPEGVSVAFSDTGTGIPPHMLERIFEPFESTKEHGMGLGLYVSRTLVEEHGGWIRVESRPGEGTTFTVWLPMRE